MKINNNYILHRLVFSVVHHLVRKTDIYVQGDPTTNNSALAFYEIINIIDSPPGS